jgi:ribose transport system permease protein
MTLVRRLARSLWLAPGRLAPGRLAPGRLKKGQSLAALAGIILLAILTSPAAADGSRIFLQIGNLTDILRQVSLIGIMALAMTYVILTGGIDLSVGSILALSTALVAMGLTRGGQTAPSAWHMALTMAAAMAAAIAASALVGTLIGAVIAVTRIQPFIVTLAAMIGVRGLAKWLTDNQNIDIGFGRDVAAEFAAVFRQKAIVIGAYAAGAAISWVMLARTVFGRHVRAIGDNEKAAEYAGLPIRRTKVWVYTLSGLLSGLAGVLYAAENHQGNPNAGVAYELDAIAAVVIGGTRLSGGKGGISGTIVGTLIMGVLTNMLRLNNVDSNVEMMIKAAIIVLAVAVQRQ